MSVGTCFSDRILPWAQYGATTPAESVGPTTSILASTRAPEYKLELKPYVSGTLMHRKTGTVVWGWHTFCFKIGLLDLIQQTKLILLQLFFNGKKTILQHVKCSLLWNKDHRWLNLILCQLSTDRRWAKLSSGCASCLLWTLKTGGEFVFVIPWIKTGLLCTNTLLQM